MEYLYDWIKEHKRLPDDPKELDAYAQQEYRWLHELTNGDIHDSYALYTKLVSQAYLNNGTPQSVAYLKRHSLTPDDIAYIPFDKLYSYVQQGHMTENHFGRVTFRLAKSNCIKYIELRRRELDILCYCVPDMNMMMAFATNGHWGKYSPTLCKYLAPALLRKLSYSQLLRAKHLLRDTDNIGVHAITSLNQLQELHDAQATVRRIALARSKKAVYKYSPKLEAAVKHMHGWWLPKGNLDLAQRGEEHHNCVASYELKHCEDFTTNRHTVSRLLMATEATAELRISLDVRTYRISDVKIVQCRGIYNRELRWPQTMVRSWSETRKMLLGLTPEDWHVEVEDEGHEEVNIDYPGTP